MKMRNVVGVLGAVGLLAMIGCSTSHLVVEATISITSPTADQNLAASDDEDTTTAGLQFSVQVKATNLGEGTTLVLETEEDGAFTATENTTTLQADGTATFDPQTFAAGEHTIRVSDESGAVNSETITFSVVSIEVAITSPANGATLGADDDCNDQMDGFQIEVNADINAGDGTAANLWIGGDPDSDDPTDSVNVTTGKVSFCTNAGIGTDITLTVGVGTNGSEGRAQVQVSINTLTALSLTTAPTYFEDEADAAKRRGGEVNLAWTAIADVDSYVIRCATSDITDEAGWDAAAASEIALTTKPGDAGTEENEDVSGFKRLGVSHFCALRGKATGDLLTPLGTTIEVINPFKSVRVRRTDEDATSSNDPATIARKAEAVGDVNGDDLVDVLIAGNRTTNIGNRGEAYLYFGDDDGTLGEGTGVTFFSSNDGGQFGSAVVGIGDFDGDGENDFAISDPWEGGFTGAVYLIFGRTSANPWPAILDVSAAGCANACCVDVCFRGANTNAGGQLGISLGAAGNFDNDSAGRMDLLIGAPNEDGANGFSFFGQVYVINGRAAGDLAPVYDFSTTIPDGFLFRGNVNVSLGNGVAGVGNTSGSAHADVAAAGVGWDNSTPTVLTDDNQGELHYVEGRDHSGAGNGLVVITDGTIVDTRSPINLSSYSVTSIGDYNGDMIADLATYDAMDDTSGQVQIYLGSSTGYSSSSTLLITNDEATNPGGDQYGWIMATGGHPALSIPSDYDGDGSSDFAVGAVSLGAGNGTADLFYGVASPANRARSQADVTLPDLGGQTKGVQWIGDGNNAGFADLAVLSNNSLLIMY